ALYGLCLTLFTGPLIGAIPLCFVEQHRRTYRGYYLRGMSFAIIFFAILILVLTIILVQSCQSGDQDTYTSDMYGNVYVTTYNCNAFYSRLLPIVVLWGILGAALLRKSSVLISLAASNDNDPSVQYVPAMVQQQQQQQMQQSPNAYPEPNLPPYSPPTDGKMEFTPPGVGSSQPQAYVSGQYVAPPVSQPPVKLSTSLSLESLALQLEIPKLLTVQEGVNGVLEMSFNEMKEKYGITPEEFMKIKAYRKSLEH
ncbi:hypothetical protein BCR33DRAFT_712873, partial [Rhizoclosmatium globosum]